MRRSITIAVLLLVVGVSALSAALLIRMAPSLDNPAQAAAVNTIIAQISQFSLIGILGVLAKWMIDESQRTTDERRALRARQDEQFGATSNALRELLRQTRLAHHAVRTMPLDAETAKTVEAYRTGMRSLLAARQRYIEIGDEIRHTELRRSVDASVHADLAKVINYLSSVLTESYVAAPASWTEVTALPEYGGLRAGTIEFRQPNASPHYRSGYDDHYEAVKSALHAALDPHRLRATTDTLVTL